MTDDYKKQLLNYITGNVTQQTGVNEPILTEDDGTIDSSHIGFIRSMLIAEGYSTGGEVMTGVFTELGKIQFTNTDKILIYGNMSKIGGGVTPRGAIIVADENYKYLSYITTFRSGTQFRQFAVLKADETNLVYGVDYDENGNERFLLLNDIIGSYLAYGEYTCVLRKSYNFPAYSLSSLMIYDAYKEYNSANYLFIGQTQKSNNRFTPTIITVDVNVGQENEWHQYTSNNEVDMTLALGSFCNWQNDTLQLKFACPDFFNEYYYEYSFDGTTISRTKNIIAGGINAIEMIDNNTTYIISYFYDIENSQTYAIIKYQVVESSSITTFKTETILGSINIFQPYVTNGLLFLLLEVYDENTEQRTQEVNLIINQDFYSNPIENVRLYTNENLAHDFIVVNHFNLYKMYYSSYYQQVTTNPRSIIGSTSLDYNSTNYNGEPYIDYNMLVTHKGRLYDETGLIFARNLYNKTTLNNSTTSTLQVPNTMLNDVTIVNKQLLGETDLTLVQDNNSLTKNIYETLFINFINTINVIDEDTSEQYPATANYINTNINVGTSTNYNNTACTKYRINYADSTTLVNSLNWTAIDKFNKETSISIYVDKTMTSIDLISNNESTIYLTIPLEVEVGKYYTLKQKVRTGDKPTPVQLQYNNEDINYNNQPVMVYIKE